MEYEQGMGPDVRRFFQKIISTLSWGLLWLMTAATAGLYFRLGLPDERPVYAMVLYYVLAVVTLLFLLRYYYHLWKK